MSTNTNDARNTCCLRNLKRIKIFLGRRAVTFVTYYRNTDYSEEAADFIGRVNIWYLWKRARVRVEAAHTRLPPSHESDGDEEPEEEVDPTVTHGYNLLPA